uniref:Uncharacterized protein n=2 Tax=Clytia hemisphaerica TaxID=252671 RepID=A0A7M5WZ66_9CNID
SLINWLQISYKRIGSILKSYKSVLFSRIMEQSELEDDKIEPREKEKNYLIYHVESYDDTNNILHDHEQTHGFKYACWYQSKNFGNSDFYEKTHKIMWNDETITFSGVPFIILGTKKLDCHFGKDRNIVPKKRRLAQKAEADKPYKNPRSIRMTVKNNCPCQVVVKELVHFPDHTITGDTKWKRETGSKLLRKAIKNRTLANFKKSFILMIPPAEEHVNHPNMEVIQVIRNPERPSPPATQITHKVRKPPPKPPICWGEKTRDLLDEVKTLTYLMENEESVMKDLHSNLEEIKKYMILAIQEKDQVRNSVLSVGSDTQQEEHHHHHQHIVVAKTDHEEDGQHSKPTHNDGQNIKTIKQDLVVERQPGSENEVQLFIEHPSLTKNEMLVPHHHTENEEEEPGTSSTTIEEEDPPNIDEDVIRQHNLNPQEFQVLTNMIHVLLEEKNSSVDPPTT